MWMTTFKRTVFVCFLILFITASSYGIGGAANSRSSDTHHETATVDTAPGASGYATNPIVIRDKMQNQTLGHAEVVFAITAPAGTIGTMTVTLQYKAKGDAEWSDYPTTFDTYAHTIIRCNAFEILWRAIVKDDAAYTSGTMTFGFYF